MKWIEEAVEKKKKQKAKKLPLKYNVLRGVYEIQPAYEPTRMVQNSYQKQPMYKDRTGDSRMLYD